MQLISSSLTLHFENVMQRTDVAIPVHRLSYVACPEADVITLITPDQEILDVVRQHLDFRLVEELLHSHHLLF